MQLLSIKATAGTLDGFQYPRLAIGTLWACVLCEKLNVISQEVCLGTAL